MKRTAPVLALALSACAAGPGPDDGPRLRPAANPSAVIAAEIAFNRLAQEKGQWTAFRDTAAKEAEMFVPQRVRAADWLRGRADPPVPVRWQPTQVWSSCDGSYAVTRGAWQRPGSQGSFATVWQRQNNGTYKWLLDMSLADEAAVAADDTVLATVADCPRQRPDGPGAATPGQSDDGTLRWQAEGSAAGARRFTLWIAKDGAMRDVLTARLGARSGE